MNSQEAMALSRAKSHVRSLMKIRLSEVSQESITSQSNAVFKSLQNFKPYQESKRIGIYLSMPTGEIQTDAIVRHALNNGKKVFVPYIHRPQNQPPNTPKSVMDMVDLHSLSDYDSLKRDNWGIPSIGKETVDEREHVLMEGVHGLDLILMPGVAFEPLAPLIKRLGHGKGFYDYFLQRYKDIHQSPVMEQSDGPRVDALLYGLALEEQYLVPPKTAIEVPAGEQDCLLHGLVVGDGTIVEPPSPEK